MVLCLVLVFSLAGCGNNDQSSDTHDANYEEGYTAGYEAGYNDGCLLYTSDAADE